MKPRCASFTVLMRCGHERGTAQRCVNCRWLSQTISKGEVDADIFRVCCTLCLQSGQHTSRYGSRCTKDEVA
jgi:hypothetical protein